MTKRNPKIHQGDFSSKVYIYLRILILLDGCMLYV